MERKVCQAHSLNPDAPKCSGHWRRFRDEPCKTARRMQERQVYREAFREACRTGFMEPLPNSRSILRWAREKANA